MNTKVPTKKIQKICKDNNNFNKKRNFENCMRLVNKACKKEKIQVTNIEFRHFDDAYFQLNEIKGEIFIEDLNSIINEIKNYYDNKILNDYYKELINNVLKNNKKLINTIKNNKLKYFDQIKHLIKNKDLNEFINDYYRLIDARIVHTIYINKDKKNIFICVGNSHIKEIQKILKRIDFKESYNAKLEDILEPINLNSHLSKIKIN